MKSAILQPHYIPWIGYFSMIKNVDTFIFLDDVKFIKREWKNRNKIRKTKDSIETKWLSVPIKKKDQNNNLNQIEIDYDEEWRETHINSIKEVYKKTKYFENYSEKIFNLINSDYKTLTDLNVTLILFFLKEFKINTKILYSSSLNVNGKKGEKLLNICKKINSNHYLANTLSQGYIDENLFKINNIKLEYQNFKQKKYLQISEKKNLRWLSNLSIIDYIFNQGFNIEYL